MDTNTHTEIFSYPGYLDPAQQLTIAKSKTICNVDIVHVSGAYDQLYDCLTNRSNSFNIIDYQAISEFDMAHYTRCALKHLPKKENIVIGYPTEALNTTYWNVVFDILQEAGYKKIMWIDGGLTPGPLFRHLHHLKVTHFRSPMFFGTLFRPMIVEKMPGSGDLGDRKVHYLSLGRLVRQERIYFTKKLLDNPTLFNKGIVTCGWGDSTLNFWQNHDGLDYLKATLSDDDIKKFPLTLGHGDFDQHHFVDDFKEAIFNVVQESSIGLDFRSHISVYGVVPPNWQSVSSDRIFFTEKTAKAFLMNQIPLMIAAPGMVQVLRGLGFDMFDDIVDHSYDKEDNILKRCDMVYDELERLVSMYTVHGWVKLMQQNRFSERFFNNHTNVKKLANTNYLTNWIQENF
jgi:hypothetical protein